MDYVVFGIGFGATILVLGLLLRDFGPRLRFRKPRDGGDVLSAEELVAKVSWARFCSALGSVLALAGAAFLLITIVSMILVVSDDTGLWVMGGSLGVLMLLMLYWTWAYFHRFGSYGILPERVEKPEPAPALATPRPRPSGPRPQVYAGPPAPAAETGADQAAEEVREEPVAVEAGTETAAETVVESDIAADPAAERVEPEPATTESVVAVSETSETDTAARLQTPEERLAQSETPIDHGSAEGELGLATSRPGRPAFRTATPRVSAGAEAADANARTVAGPPIPSDIEAEG